MRSISKVGSPLTAEPTISRPLASLVHGYTAVRIALPSSIRNSRGNGLDFPRRVSAVSTCGVGAGGGTGTDGGGETGLVIFVLASGLGGTGCCFVFAGAFVADGATATVFAVRDACVLFSGIAFIGGLTSGFSDFWDVFPFVTGFFDTFFLDAEVVMAFHVPIGKVAPLSIHHIQGRDVMHKVC